MGQIELISRLAAWISKEMYRESVVWSEDCLPVTENHNISAPHPQNLKQKVSMFV